MTLRRSFLVAACAITLLRIKPVGRQAAVMQEDQPW
jgi:hypothetical protein